MKVYITYDKSFHEIICVHQMPNIDCPICKPIRELKDRNDDNNNLIEIEKELYNDAKRYDSPAIISECVSDDTELFPEIDLDLLPDHKEENISIADEEDLQSETLFFNRNTGKMQKLFDVLNKVYTVRYSNPYCGWKGEAVYITLEAENEAMAKDLAMENKEFCKHIQFEYFDRKYLHAYQPKGNYVIGKVEYFEGDERL